MKALGRHVLAEFYGCDPQALNHKDWLENMMRRAAEESGATVVSSAFHLFNPHGVSGAVIIAESHLTIHTWPEYGYAAVDLFTCGDSVDPWIAFEMIKDYLQAEQMFTLEVKRGQLHTVESLQHKPF